MSMTRLLLFPIFCTELLGYQSVLCCEQAQMPRGFGDYASMWGASLCSCLSHITSAIIYYHILCLTNNVVSGDFKQHHGWSSVNVAMQNHLMIQCYLCGFLWPFHLLLWGLTWLPYDWFLSCPWFFGGRLILQGPLCWRKITQTCFF